MLEFVFVVANGPVGDFAADRRTNSCSNRHVVIAELFTGFTEKKTTTTNSDSIPTKHTNHESNEPETIAVIDLIRVRLPHFADFG
jgi:hypothetical protein